MSQMTFKQWEQDLLDEAQSDKEAKKIRRQLVTWIDGHSQPCGHQGGEYRCGSPTYMLLRGQPRCSTHIIRELTDMLVEKMSFPAEEEVTVSSESSGGY